MDQSDEALASREELFFRKRFRVYLNDDFSGLSKFASARQIENFQSLTIEVSRINLFVSVYENSISREVCSRSMQLGRTFGFVQTALVALRGKEEV
jgi:hypothetical protein